MSANNNRDYTALSASDARDLAVEDVREELFLAESRYPAFASAHEGYAILLEEVDEIWDEIKKPPAKRDMVKVRAEAVQVAAMALRLIVDVCDPEDA